MLFDVRYSEMYEMNYAVLDGYVTIAAYKGDSSHITIPEYIEGCPVEKIEPYAFAEKKMKYITLPATLKHIGHHAFSECHEVLRIEFPYELNTIGNYAFYNCFALEAVHLTPFVPSIGFGAFKNCEKLREIIQDKVEGHDISIGSILDDLNQSIHVVMRHIFPDGHAEDGRVTFTEHDYEVVPNVASMCKQFESTEIGSGKYIRYCIGNNDVDYIKYDSMFYVLLRGDSFDTIARVVCDRLMYPYMLTADAAKRYTDYLRQHGKEAVMKFIRDDEMAVIQFIGQQEILDEAAVDAAIDLCVNLKKEEYTAFFMDYRHTHFSMADMSFDL